MSLKGKGASSRAMEISHIISGRVVIIFPDEKDLVVFTRWYRGVKYAIFETIEGRLSSGKKIPENRNIGVIKRVLK